MFRVLGFILGSVATIAGIFFVMGTPEFHLSNFETDQARFDAALQKVRNKRPVAGQTAANPARNLQQGTDAPGASESPGKGTPTQASQPEVPVSDEDSKAAAPGLAQQFEALTESRERLDIEQQWGEFWSPFRSEIAAKGFVSQLEKVTGLDYRILKVKAGVYRVEFAYTNDAERQLKISRISAATGLELP